MTCLSEMKRLKSVHKKQVVLPWNVAIDFDEFDGEACWQP